MTDVFLDIDGQPNESLVDYFREIRSEILKWKISRIYKKIF